MTSPKPVPHVYVNGAQVPPSKKVKLYEKRTKKEIRDLIQKAQGKK